MVKGVTLSFNGTAFSSRLIYYDVQREIKYKKVVKNLLGKERAYGKEETTVVYFRLLAADSSQIELDYDVLSDGIATVVFSDPNTNTDRTLTMRVDSNLSQEYGLKSYNNKVYYESETITLRETAV